MKKRVKGRKFNRTKDQRKAFFKSLLSNLFLKERIKTTEARAKELKRMADKHITKAKKITLTNRRMLLKNLNKKAVKKLETEIAPRYKERKGGYTRIVKLGPRKSDGSKMALIELIK